MTKGLIFAAVAVAGGVVVTVGLAATALARVNRLCKRLNMSLDDIEKRTTISVSDELIDTVVSDMAKRSLDRTIPLAVGKAVDSSVLSAEVNIHKQIKEKVDEARPGIMSKLNQQLDDVNINEMKQKAIEEAVERAKREAMQKVSDEIRSAASDAKKRMQREIESEVKDCVSDLRQEADSKFDAELDGLTTRYKSRLDDISDIYASLANKVTK